MKNSLEIAILLYDQMTALDAVGPYEVLSRLPNAQIKFVAETKGLKNAGGGKLALRADYLLEEVPSPDVLLVPGGDASEPRTSRKVLDWITNAHQTTQYTVSVCSGALVLGAANLLKGKKATTHWLVKDRLTELAKAEYVPERYVQTGKIITAAGVSAGIDAALFLAEKLTDAQTAKVVQLSIEYDPQPPFDAGSLEKADEQTIEKTKKYFAEKNQKT